MYQYIVADKANAERFGITGARKNENGMAAETVDVLFQTRALLWGGRKTKITILGH